MKTSFFILLIANLFSLLLSAQTRDSTNSGPVPEKSSGRERSAMLAPKRSFCFGTLGVGTPLTTRLAVEYITAKELSFSVFASFSTRDSPNTPRDYSKADFLGGGVSHTVQENLILGGLTVGKAWWVTEGGRMRFNLKGGATIGVFATPEHFVPSHGNNFANYAYDRVNRLAAGLALQPTLQFAISPYFGLSLGAFALLNKHRNIIGLDGAISFGKLRDKRYK